MDFIPQNSFKAKEIPFFEDAGEADIAGADLRKPIAHYQSQVSQAITKLGGFVSGFMPGMYPGTNQRYGFRVSFILDNMPGRIDVAALPIRKETEIKKDKAQKQALYLLWKELNAAADAWAYRPNSVPLLPYLIGPGGRTVTEQLLERGTLPEMKPTHYLPAPNGR